MGFEHAGGRAVDPADGEHYVYGHSFMDAAPRVFACFDQPDLKGPYTFHVTAPSDWVVEVDGKGDRHRIMPISDALAREIRVYAMAEGRRGYLWPGQHDGHISPAWVGTLVSRELPRGEAMHALRHRFATDAFEVDRDLLAVQLLLGHASPETTRRYIMRDDAVLRRTVLAVAR